METKTAVDIVLDLLKEKTITAQDAKTLLDEIYKPSTQCGHTTTWPYYGNLQEQTITTPYYGGPSITATLTDQPTPPKK
jgi:hypothetical protein